MAYMIDGNMLVATDRDVEVWEINTDVLLHRFTYKDRIECINYHFGSKYAYIGFSNGNIETVQIQEQYMKTPYRITLNDVGFSGLDQY